MSPGAVEDANTDEESGEDVGDDGILLPVARPSPLPVGTLDWVVGSLFGSSSIWSLLESDASSLRAA
jgi:hypothetical protein